MGRLFDVQPEWCRQPLDVKTVKNFDRLHERMKRLVLFNPTEIYKRIDKADAINPFSRHTPVSIGLLFPRKEGYCACGCGEKLTGRQSVWSGKGCQELPVNVQSIISGHSYIRSVCINIFTADCCVCGEKERFDTHELDHKFPVKFGGGGGWLTNYEFKCKKCHRDKTNSDFGFGKYQSTIQSQRSLSMKHHHQNSNNP